MLCSRVRVYRDPRNDKGARFVTPCRRTGCHKAGAALIDPIRVSLTDLLSSSRGATRHAVRIDVRITYVRITYVRITAGYRRYVRITYVDSQQAMRCGGRPAAAPRKGAAKLAVIDRSCDQSCAAPPLRPRRPQRPLLTDGRMSRYSHIAALSAVAPPAALSARRPQSWSRLPCPFRLSPGADLRGCAERGARGRRRSCCPSSSSSASWTASSRAGRAGRPPSAPTRPTGPSPRPILLLCPWGAASCPAPRARRSSSTLAWSAGTTTSSRTTTRSSASSPA